MAPGRARREMWANRASLTLLDAARADIKNELRDDSNAKLDLAGFGFGMEEDIAEKEPISPTSPLTNAVRKSSVSKPSAAIVHRVRLNKFDERKEPGRTFTRRRSADDGYQPTNPMQPEFRRQRANSVPCGGSADAAARQVFSRPTSAGSLNSAGRREGSEDAPQVRDLSSQEMTKKNKEAVDWFKNSRSINRKIRSIEDTDALLAVARERRASGAPPPLPRRKSLEIPLEEKAEDTSKKEAEVVVPKRRTVDAAALWGAKALLPKPKEEVKPEIAEALGNEKKKSCMRGDVTVGQTGENSLLARLKRRSTIG